MKNIVLLIGSKAHSGKSFFSRNLESFLSNRNANIIRCSLSTYIRDIAKNDFFWDGIDTSESRKFMGEVYRLGSEIYPYHMARRVWERDIVPNLKGSYNIIIVESFREVNNYTYFKMLQDKELIDKIITVNIKRPNFSDISKQQESHISEVDLNEFSFDCTILNDGTIEDLKNKAKEFANELIKELDIDVKIPEEDLITGSTVKVIDVLDKNKAYHLMRYIGKQGEILNWIKPSENSEKRYKVIFDSEGVTAYFRKSELKVIND